DAARAEPLDRLEHGAVAAADGDEPDLGAAAPAHDRRRHGGGGASHLAYQPIDHLLVRVRVFRVAAELVVARAAREVRAARVTTGQRAGGDAVAIYIEVTVEGLHLLELFRGQHLAAVGPVRLVPAQLRHEPVVHADVE